MLITFVFIEPAYHNQCGRLFSLTSQKNTENQSHFNSSLFLNPGLHSLFNSTFTIRTPKPN